MEPKGNNLITSNRQSFTQLANALVFSLFLNKPLPSNPDKYASSCPGLQDMDPGKAEQLWQNTSSIDQKTFSKSRRSSLCSQKTDQSRPVSPFTTDIKFKLDNLANTPIPSSCRRSSTHETQTGIKTVRNSYISFNSVKGLNQFCCIQPFFSGSVKMGKRMVST